MGTPDADAQTPPETPAPANQFDRLCHRVSRQPGGPDRHTIFPRDVDAEQRTVRWLTVDAACVVDLESVR
ncbi:hypothetical protein U4E84_09930 [Halorubrum sp. AD140]|uniref:DUF7511 domain-containing protein n=1 Tax=Halorubrum sp. AD140 TaxID=3050073 RepID=UPI002ACC67D7|nr:hypothetical protein [Halorubrum sp. AD140]MDZ5811660.1 hypothetical protein [Halorubrum sp. AD140]